MSRIRNALSLFVLGFLSGCGLLAISQSGTFTRDHLPILADDLRDAADLAVAFDPTLAGSPYVTLARGVADRWDGYYLTGQEVSLDFMLAEAQELSRNIEASLVAEGADPERAARIRAIVGVVLRRLERLAPPAGPPPLPGPPVVTQPTQ